VPSVPMPGYPTFRIGLPSVKIALALSRFRPDVVHLASPFALGSYGMAAAHRLGLPAVAVYQTDVPRFAAGYGFGFTRAAAWRWLRRVHNYADRTLAPSTAAVADLTAHGIERVRLWRRGVDTERFQPGRRSESLRAGLVSEDGLLIGYVGRLAPEKHLELLRPVGELPGVRLVLVGDGPDRARLRRLLPTAAFLGELDGTELATAFASLDVFVHTGPFETFCQTVQEALASGVPVIAPDCGGPRDLVLPGRTGLLVPPCDGPSLTAAVKLLADDEPLRRRLAAGARPSVADRSWAVIGDELIAHYREVLADRDEQPLPDAA